MKEENLDRRIRKTRKLLRQCLAALLKEKRIQDITVREISDMADINRGTFYLHYKDVFDLMDQIELELLEELEDVLNHYQAGDLLSKPSGIFSEVYSLVRDNADMVSILIGDNGDLNFVNRLNAIVREKCLKDWVEFTCPRDSVSFDAYFSFIVSGHIGIVQYWLNTGMLETPEQLAQMTEQIMLKGIRIFDPEAKLPGASEAEPAGAGKETPTAEPAGAGKPAPTAKPASTAKPTLTGTRKGRG